MLQAVRQGLDACLDRIPDVLPQDVRERCRLAQTAYAYENIHFPKDFDALELARRRLIFEELFVLACALGRIRGERVREEGIKLSVHDMSRFWASLPFSPTGAQKRAIEQALGDISSGAVMNRLVQGDVGSGKNACRGGTDVAVRRKRIYERFHGADGDPRRAALFDALLHARPARRVYRVKLTGAMSAKEKRETKAKLKAGEYDIVVGTHALFSQDVEYSNLALVVTDEQHRFGVGQRSALIGKGRSRTCSSCPQRRFRAPSPS